MISILITGANSYIGTSFEKWVKQWPNEYRVDTIDLKDGSWREKDFSLYDVVFHVAGIAHVDVKRSSEEQKELYYRVNRDLTIETAKKAKDDYVKQFIFMSSIIVYGDSAPIGKKRIITKETLPSPSNFYGDSKLQAEEGIIPFQSDDFNVAVLRPPMIYGKGSKGNYPKLAKLAKTSPIFPTIRNERSMLHIDNLCEFIRLIITHEENGIFFPQNKDYVQSANMVKLISEIHGHQIKFIKMINPLVYMLGKFTGIVNKVFGNLYYDKQMSNYKFDYQVKDFYESLLETEKN